MGIGAAVLQFGYVESAHASYMLLIPSSWKTFETIHETVISLSEFFFKKFKDDFSIELKKCCSEAYTMSAKFCPSCGLNLSKYGHFQWDEYQDWLRRMAKGDSEDWGDPEEFGWWPYGGINPLLEVVKSGHKILEIKEQAEMWLTAGIPTELLPPHWQRDLSLYQDSVVTNHTLNSLDRRNLTLYGLMDKDLDLYPKEKK